MGSETKYIKSLEIQIASLGSRGEIRERALLEMLGGA